MCFSDFVVRCVLRRGLLHVPRCATLFASTQAFILSGLFKPFCFEVLVVMIHPLPFVNYMVHVWGLDTYCAYSSDGALPWCPAPLSAGLACLVKEEHNTSLCMPYCRCAWVHILWPQHRWQGLVVLQHSRP